MSDAAEDTQSRGFTLDRPANTIRFERLLEAPPDDVFDAWTEPRHVSSWWDPTGSPLENCTIELRVGGTFSFVTKDHHGTPFTGTYREIDRPNLLVFEALGAIGRIRLSATDGGTHMTVEIVCSSAEHLQQFAQIGVAVNTGRTLDNLVRHMQR